MRSNNYSITVGRPNIGDEKKLHAYLEEIISSKWLTNNGRFVKELENRLSQFTRAKHVIAVSNGTVGLEIAIRSLNLTGEVIVPSYTFVATAHALTWLGLKPIFSEIDPQTCNLDPSGLENLITENTSGIIPVNVYGRPAPIREIMDIAQSHKLKVIFDSAHAFGNSYEGTMIGNFGNAEVFSFHATKFYNTFEGGAITTNDDVLAERMRAMRNFGFSEGEGASLVGTNGKMNEMSAAMGLVNLDSINEFVEVNSRCYRIYKEMLHDLPGITLLEYDENEKCNFQYVIIMIDEEAAGYSRDQLFIFLHHKGINTRKYFYPGCHRMEPYKTLFPDLQDHLPITDRIASQVLALPTGKLVSPADIRYITKLIKEMSDYIE